MSLIDIVRFLLISVDVVNRKRLINERGGTGWR
jgi:hypothetical protein